MYNNKYQQLRELAIQAAEKAYNPYSHCAVGSALITDTAKIYSGNNIENASYGASICAERVAICKAISDDHKARIKAIYIYTESGWPPCGICRQFMSEFAAEDMEVIIGNKAELETSVRFTDLMPWGFDHSYLK